ncbi:NAD-P-binding protein [Coprinopsis marcescibilis]|uniref:NAD-P-binding protein n=1 Tax=Coprinopsis marcescibilis TaxID=230819 RepID=A0A5C3LF00_COPMA|nr:NAD-P-binding protein [Coprinopsis marcescibilis]
MRLLVLGATGPCGILLIREALEKYPESTIVVYARSPEKLPEDLAGHKSLFIVKGLLTDAEAFSNALDGVDAVVSALGPSTLFKTVSLTECYEVVVDCMKKKNVNRIVLLGTASIADPNDTFSFKYKALIATVAALAYPFYTEIVGFGETIRTKADELDWTIVRVPILTNNESKDVVAGYVGDARVGITLTRRAFAAFVLQEVEERRWVKKRPMISSP